MSDCNCEDCWDCAIADLRRQVEIATRALELIAAKDFDLSRLELITDIMHFRLVTREDALICRAALDEMEKA